MGREFEILDRLVREGVTEVTFKERSERSEDTNFVNIGKYLEVETYLTCSKTVRRPMRLD